MPRSLCWVLVAGLAWCGCAKKDGRPEAMMPAAGSSVPETESNVPAPSAPAEHPVVATAHVFLQAVAAGDYRRALALSVPGDSAEITPQGLEGMRVAFQLDQAAFDQAWLGSEQASVITSFIPARQGAATAAWAINLVVAQDGRWLVRLCDIMFNEQMVQDYLAAFHEVAPNAKAIEL